MEKEYLVDLRKLFIFYKGLGEKAMNQLSDEELMAEAPPGINSVSVLVKHLAGNMKSRFTDFLLSDGEKPWRERDMEFVDDLKVASALWSLWASGWSVLLGTLDTLSSSDLNRTVKIRNREQKVFAALNRQLGHYAYHIGQLVDRAKALKGDQWQSLSIPLGQSERYNQKMFEQGDADKHFTEDL